MGRVVISEVFLAALAVGLLTAVISGLWRSVTRGRGRGSMLGAALLDGALAASLAGVLVATLTPVELIGTHQVRPVEINLRPLEAMRGAPRVYALVNAVLLVPTIFLLAQRWRRAGVIRLTLAGAALSLAIEVTQLLHPLRGTNVDDLALNTAGGAVAAVLGVTVRLLRRRRDRRGPDHDGGGSVPERGRSAARTH